MNADADEVNVFALLEALPFTTTLLDREGCVIRQFHADNTPLFTPPHGAFLAENHVDLVAILRQTVDSGLTNHFETEHASPDGESRWFAHDVTTVHGNPGLIVSSWEITAYKTQERALRRIKRRYDAILDNTRDAVTISTWGETYDDKELLYANRRTEELLGYNLDELRTMRPSDLLANDYKATAFQRHLLRDASEEPLEMVPSFPIVRKDGSIRHVQSLGIVIHDETGKKIEAVAVVRDITERIERQEQLEQAKLAAEAALTARDVFVANITEDLQLPLGNIIRHTELLLAQTDLSPLVADHLHHIREDANCLTRQIRDVLDLSRVEAGFDILQMSMFHLHFLFKRLQDTMNIKARRLHTTLSVKLADNLPVLVRMDEVKLKQIVIRLTDEAIGELSGGKVTLQVERCGEDSLAVSVTPVSLAHEGESDLAATEDSPNLAICRRLAEAMGGRLALIRTQAAATIRAELPYVAVRSEASTSDMPAMPCRQELSTLPHVWLEAMQHLCVAGKREQALAHVRLLEADYPETAIQLRALLDLFRTAEIADAIAPLIGESAANMPS